MPGLVTPRRMLLAVVLGGVLFAGSYGVGRAGEGGKSEPPPAARPATVPEIGGLEAAEPLPAQAKGPRPRKASEPAAPVVAQPEPEAQPQPTEVPVQPITPAPRPAPTPKPVPAPTPAPGGGFDDSG